MLPPVIVTPEEQGRRTRSVTTVDYPGIL